MKKEKVRFKIIIVAVLVGITAFGVRYSILGEIHEKRSIMPTDRSAIVSTVSRTYSSNSTVSAKTSSEKAVSSSSVSSVSSKGTVSSKSSSGTSSKNSSSKAVSSKNTSSKDNLKPITAKDVRAYSLSVSSVEVTWTASKDREYEVEVFTEAPYVENIDFVFKEKGRCYITGLREDSEYEITVTPILEKNEKKKYKAVSGKACTSTKSAGEVIQEYDYEDGWTACFAGERASGLTAMPSSGAIYGSKVDEVTGTGIRRFENGDYCCAMGEWYGECGDRFLVELENGIQFTVRICDSKGWADDADGDGEPDGRFHWFGGTGNGKCVIEFIYDDANLPSCVAFSGSWGYYNWNGLNLCSNIKQIQKLATW